MQGECEAATNTPEAIEEAVMSRFGKKIEISLPDLSARRAILKIHTEKKEIGLVDECLYDKLANYCVGHKMSGRDITFSCTEAIWKMRDEMNPGLEKLAEEPYEKIKVHKLKTRKLKDSDFNEAVQWQNRHKLITPGMTFIFFVHPFSFM